MNLPEGLGERAVRDVVRERPAIGEIFARRGIACAECSVGVCLVKDVVGIHGLSPAEEARVEAEIRACLAEASPASDGRTQP